MATTASLVKDIRRQLGDRPIRTKLTAAISDTTTETFSVSAAHALQFAVGELWEHADDSGEVREITVVDTATPQITGTRGGYFSTAATHSNSTFLEKYPRWRFDLVSDAIDQCIANDLWPWVYEIVEHEVVSQTPATGFYYNAPSANCERFLEVYQWQTAPAKRLGDIVYTPYPMNADTDLQATGKAFYIRGRTMDGTAKFYVNCAHRLALSTLSTEQEALVRVRACQYLLQWTAPGRLQGPTNQGDRTVRPGDELRTAAYYEQEYGRLRRRQADDLRKQTPPQQLWTSGSGPTTFYQPNYPS